MPFPLKLFPRLCMLSIGALLWAWPSVLPAADSSAETHPLCKFPTGRDTQVVRIDANTGQILSGKIDLPSGESASMHFVHKNPFKFSYSYTITGKTIDPLVGKAALKTLFGIGDTETSDSQTSVKGQDGKPGPGDQSTQSVINCPLANETDANAASDSASEVLDLFLEVKARIRLWSAESNSLVKELQTIVPTNAYQCESLRTAGKSLLTIAERRKEDEIKLASLRERLESAAMTLKSKYSDDILKRLEAGSDPCRKIKEAVMRAEEAIEKADEQILEEQKRLIPVFKAFDETTTTVKRVLDDPNAFVDVRALGPTREATDYTITINRLESGDNSKPTAIPVNTTIRLGQRRFFYSVGLAYAFSDQKNFGRESSVLESGETGSIIAITSESSGQFGAVAQLNARIYSWSGSQWRASWGWALGASVTQGEDDADFGFFMGPYLGFGERFFLTAGYRQSDENSLGGGFSVGDVVPADLTGEIPIRTKSEGRWLLSISYSFD